MNSEAANARHLADRVASGDRSAENALVECSSPGVMAALRAWRCEPSLAFDICNDTLLTVIERLRREPLADPDKLAAFTVGTARKKLANLRRKDKRRQTYCDSERIEQVASTAQGPADIAEREERVNIVYQLLAEMKNARDRKVLSRFYLDQEDKAIICDELDIDVHNFNNIIYRARKRFRVLVDRAQKRANLTLV